MESEAIINDSSLQTLTIEVTKKCNLRCGHCFSRIPDDPRPAMTLETAKEIAIEGFELGFTCVHLTGGEATLWKHFLPFVKFCWDLGYQKVYFNTNGMYLKEPLCKELSHYKDRLNISVSIDGNESLHNSLRGEGSFAKTCKGLENALQYELPIEIFTTVRKSLIPELPNFTKMLYDKFPTIKFLVLIQLVNVEKSFQDMNDELLSPEDFIATVRNASLLNLFGYRVVFLENPLTYVVSQVLGLNFLFYSPNRIRYEHIVVLANMKMTGNHSSLYDYGYYHKGRLREILEDKNYHLLGRDRDKPCRTCEFMPTCRKHGLSYPADIRYDNDTSAPFCKRVLQTIQKQEGEATFDKKSNSLQMMH